jgi:hypothetical protein
MAAKKYGQTLRIGIFFRTFALAYRRLSGRLHREKQDEGGTDDRQ